MHTFSINLGWTSKHTSDHSSKNTPEYTYIYLHKPGNCRHKVKVHSEGSHYLTVETMASPLAHMHPTSVRSLIPEYTNDDSMCTVCIQAKHKQKFIQFKVKRTSKPFELVHSHACGPFSTPTFGCNKHFILFADDYTRFTFVWMLSDKKHQTIPMR